MYEDVQKWQVEERITERNNRGFSKDYAGCLFSVCLANIWRRNVGASNKIKWNQLPVYRKV